MEFYEQLQEALKKREIPGAKFSQVTLPEGGPMSGARFWRAWNR